jgi:hypothetical protein
VRSETKRQYFACGTAEKQAVPEENGRNCSWILP